MAYTKHWHTKYLYCVDMGNIRLLATIDLEAIEAVLESHLGPDYTVVVLRCGEKITVQESYDQVKSRLVRMSLECQLGEVIT